MTQVLGATLIVETDTATVCDCTGEENCRDCAEGKCHHCHNAIDGNDMWTCHDYDCLEWLFQEARQAGALVAL